MLAFSRTLRGRLSGLEMALLGFLVLLGLTTLASGETPNPVRYAALAAFLISLAETLLIVTPRNMARYFNAIFFTATTQAFAHIAWVKSGREASNFGRYLFFGGQPNLGGEIAAMAAVAGAYAVKRPLYFLCVAVLVSDVLLLQSRSALLTIVPAAMVAAVFTPSGVLRRRALLATGFLAMLASPLVYQFVTSSLTHQAVSDTLQLEHAGRGTGSGFSGRTELWAIAMNLFNESPFLGHSLGHFEDIGYIGPHNFILFGLSQFGLPFCLVGGVILGAYVLAARISWYRLSLLGCVTPLLMFNDRLVNLNVYPFVFYVIALKFSLRDAVQIPRFRTTSRPANGSWRLITSEK